MENIRGYECSLYGGSIEEFLLFLADKPFKFFVKKCMKIDASHMKFPESSNNYHISAHDLRNLSKESIWELVMYAYPIDAVFQSIETYGDFLHSSCICCIIFYDCGLLDIYIKEPTLCEQIYDLLLSIRAENIEIISESSNIRTNLCP